MLALAYIKTISTANVISGILCNFKNNQGSKVVNLFRNFQNTSKNLITSLFLEGLQPVDWNAATADEEYIFFNNQLRSGPNPKSCLYF